MITPTTYLITRDSIPTLERVYGLNLTSDQKDSIKEIESRFLNEFWQFIPETVRREELQYDEVAALLGLAVSMESLPVISLDRTYIDLSKVTGEFSVTRLYNPETGETEISARPGTPQIYTQAQRIADQYEEIALVDVGAFEGGTLEEVLDIFNSVGVNVKRVYLGTLGAEAMRRLNGSVNVQAMKTYIFYEWIELRDFLGLDGRKTADGGFIPYWEKPFEWASIPEENVAAVTALCKKYNARLKEVVGDAI